MGLDALCLSEVLEFSPLEFLSLASLACLLNSAALVVFGKGLHAFLFFAVVLFNLLGLLPFKIEYP